MILLIRLMTLVFSHFKWRACFVPLGTQLPIKAHIEASREIHTFRHTAFSKLTFRCITLNPKPSSPG